MAKDKAKRAASPAPTAGAVADRARSLGGDLGRVLTADQAAGLAAYLEMLAAWNRKMNLVGPSEWPEMLSGLVADSWLLADFLESLPLAADPLCLDLGAGAGLPGIPLRLFWTAGRYRLVEPREKRAVFLRLAVGRLQLPGTAVFRGRVEALPPEMVPADLVVARAFLPWPQLLELAAGLLTPCGLVVVMANEPPPEDEPPGWRLLAARAYSLSEPSGTRWLWALTPASCSRAEPLKMTLVAT